MKNDVCLWSGKYGETKDIEGGKMKVASEISWQREYLLRIIPSDDQVIYPEWINITTNYLEQSTKDIAGRMQAWISPSQQKILLTLPRSYLLIFYVAREIENIYSSKSNTTETQLSCTG
jgi:hypothetical protein